MRRLSLVINDFALPGDCDTVLPRLPALERLLARGETVPSAAASWRHWALAEAGIRPDGPLPVAAVLAGRTGHWAVATPVHLLVGLEQVHLDPAGLPRLSADERAGLAASFDAVFGADGLRLTFADHTGLLELRGPVQADTHDPQALAGREAGAWLPSGADGAGLRRLMTEIQMWLHEHPLNDLRAQRGEPPVNALWIWGQGGTRIPVASQPLPALASDDAFLRAVWRDAGGTVSKAASRFAAAPDADAHLLATLELGQTSASLAQALETAEAGWFGPLEAALSSGRPGVARMFLGGRVLELQARDRLRFWRRRRAWHEALR